MPQGEHSAILSTFIKLQCVIKIFVCLFLSDRFTQGLLYTTIKIPLLEYDDTICDNFNRFEKYKLDIIQNVAA